MFIYRSRFLIRGEVWFEDPPGDLPVDWILYRNRSRPVAGARWRYFHNFLLDLSKSEADLAAALEPRTAHKIKTAEQKDRVECDWATVVDEGQLDLVEQLWNPRLEAQRRWGMLNRPWMRPMIANGSLELASARDSGGKLLALAAYYRNQHRLQQLLIVSPPRATAGAADRAQTNRACTCLIWRTAMRAKAQGLGCFDFGGWYPGTDDIQYLGANVFKKGFGGEVVREYECEKIVTLKALVVLTTAHLIERAREFRGRFRLPTLAPTNEATAT
jgi:hypothetical protein